MDKLIILTTDCEERTVYQVDQDKLKTLFKVLFIELSSYVDLQIPEFIGLYKMINSPIKVLKNKNNTKIKTSVKVSMDNLIYECLMQRPEDIHKARAWHVMCEDFMQLNITNPHTQQIFTLYAIKDDPAQNNPVATDLLLSPACSFSFFVNAYTLEHIEEACEQIELFLNANKIRSNYSTIYKKIVQKKDFTAFKEALEESPLKTDMLNNDHFLFTCLYNYQNPEYFFSNMLCHKIIKPRWANGSEFINFFLTYFDKTPQELQQILRNSYDKHILYQNLNKNLKKNQAGKTVTKI